MTFEQAFEYAMAHEGEMLVTINGGFKIAIGGDKGTGGYIQYNPDTYTVLDASLSDISFYCTDSSPRNVYYMVEFDANGCSIYMTTKDIYFDKHSKMSSEDVADFVINYGNFPFDVMLKYYELEATFLPAD